MYALIAMGSALTVLVVLLHRKVRLGRAMIIAAFGLGLLLGVTPAEFCRGVLNEWQTKPFTQTTGYLFVTLSALVMLVNSFGIAMKETGVAQRLVPALHGLFRSRRIALAAVPMMMGLLPTPGGIMLSAPMVREMADRIGVERSRAAAINYLFRHQWETIWPLFPSVPLIQGMFGISAFTLISHNIVIMLAGTIGSIVFLLISGIPRHRGEKISHARFIHNFRDFVHAFWPIVIVATLYVTLNLTPAAGILLALVAFLALHKVPLKRWTTIFKSGIQLDFALLILGALLFKLNLESADAISAVVDFLTRMNVPSHVLIFCLPMLVSFLTGVTMPTVAMTFPFLMAYIGTGSSAKVGLETLAFAGLMCGILATPVHLCLALSASYFEAPLKRIIIRIIGPIIFIAIAGILMAIFFG